MKPDKCDLCGRKFEDGSSYFDGATQMGPWAFMCAQCHHDHGRGLGTGRGQEFDWTTGKKIAG